MRDGVKTALRDNHGESAVVRSEARIEARMRHAGEAPRPGPAADPNERARTLAMRMQAEEQARRSRVAVWTTAAALALAGVGLGLAIDHLKGGGEQQVPGSGLAESPPPPPTRVSLASGPPASISAMRTMLSSCPMLVRPAITCLVMLARDA